MSNASPHLCRKLLVECSLQTRLSQTRLRRPFQCSSEDAGCNVCWECPVRGKSYFSSLAESRLPSHAVSQVSLVPVSDRVNTKKGITVNPVLVPHASEVGRHQTGLRRAGRLRHVVSLVMRHLPWVAWSMRQAAPACRLRGQRSAA